MRWSEQYGNNPRDPDKAAISLKLHSEDVLTPEIIAGIIGNDSWCRITCTHCDKDVTEAVTMYGGHAILCKFCIGEAMKTLGEE
jgi:hypothetical protein